MGKIFNKIYVLLLVVLVTGCASNAPKFNEVKVNFDSVDPNNGRVYLYRPSKFFGGGITPKLILNGTNIGELESGSFFFIDRPEGKYRIESRVDSVMSAPNPENQLDFTLAKGETKYIKFAITSVGYAILLARVASPVMHPEIANKKDALVELVELPYIASSVR